MRSVHIRRLLYIGLAYQSSATPPVKPLWLSAWQQWFWNYVSVAVALSRRAAALVGRKIFLCVTVVYGSESNVAICVQISCISCHFQDFRWSHLICGYAHKHVV